MKNVSMTWFNPKDHMPIKGDRVFVLYSQGDDKIHLDLLTLYFGEYKDVEDYYTYQEFKEGLFYCSGLIVMKKYVLSWAYIPDAKELLKELSSD